MVTKIQLAQKGRVIVVSIGRSIMRRMKNGHGLVTHREAIQLVPVPHTVPSAIDYISKEYNLFLCTVA